MVKFSGQFTKAHILPCNASELLRGLTPHRPPASNPPVTSVDLAIPFSNSLSSIPVFLFLTGVNLYLAQDLWPYWVLFLETTHLTPSHSGPFQSGSKGATSPPQRGLLNHSFTAHTSYSPMLPIKTFFSPISL